MRKGTRTILGARTGKVLAVHGLRRELVTVRWDQGGTSQVDTDFHNLSAVGRGRTDSTPLPPSSRDRSKGEVLYEKCIKKAWLQRGTNCCQPSL